MKFQDVSSDNNNVINKKDASSVAEIRDAIKLHPNDKTAAIDGIPADFYKANPKHSAALLHLLIKYSY